MKEEVFVEIENVVLQLTYMLYLARQLDVDPWFANGLLFENKFKHTLVESRIKFSYFSKVYEHVKKFLFYEVPTA